MTNPWFKFYPADWKADNNLRLTSAAARGLWVEMLCICHQSTPYGHLLLEDQPVTDAQLTVLTGIPLDEITRLLGELETRRIFSRTAKGVIYSRKMVKDAQKSSESKKSGKRGGNPSLCSDSIKSPTLKGTHKGGDKPQKLEARLIFTGKVIRLKQKTFDEFLALTHMDDEAFARYLDREDEWYSTQPPEVQAKWFFLLKAKLQKAKAA